MPRDPRGRPAGRLPEDRRAYRPPRPQDQPDGLQPDPRPHPRQAGPADQRRHQDGLDQRCAPGCAQGYSGAPGPHAADRRRADEELGKGTLMGVLMPLKKTATAGKAAATKPAVKPARSKLKMKW
ncbi:MAG: hypothetical protein AN484_28265 [Aphanizomenon flos-aquae WA102]|uniref:Uncharacterized protein n=1 Tax=Aphanizomenon flos-aquae WA102 TaxID=1710896 RepID=A0A1B7W4R6_APHFL|nr:MAG: hypothetical protein AN484_28265 [Aphanizomenon flos-aquae WA102]